MSKNGSANAPRITVSQMRLSRRAVAAGIAALGALPWSGASAGIQWSGSGGSGSRQTARFGGPILTVDSQQATVRCNWGDGKDRTYLVTRATLIVIGVPGKDNQQVFPYHRIGGLADLTVETQVVILRGHFAKGAGWVADQLMVSPPNPS